jgi:hypothetical protein
MAAARDSEKTISSFALGVNNRRDPDKLDTEEGRFLHSAVNVDLDAQGKMRRRAGRALMRAATSKVHSAWSDGADAFFMDGGTLYRLGGTLDLPTYTPLLTGLPVLPMSFARAGTIIMASNGAELYRIDGNSARAAGAPNLAAQPVVAAGAPDSGAMPAARYQVAVAYANADGEVGPASQPQQVEVPANGSIVLTALPATFADGATELRIYLAGANDSVLLRAETLLSGTPTHSIAVLPLLAGERCQTLRLARMPPGGIVRWCNGRLYVASGSTVFYSEPFAPALHNPARGFIAFPAPVDVMEATDAGVFIAADKTYWLGGDPSAAPLAERLPYGGVPGSGSVLRDRNAVFWMSARGIVIGNADGTVNNVQEANVAVQHAQAAATAYRERDGIKQMLSSMFGADTNRLTAQSWMDAEVVRAAADPTAAFDPF